MKTTASTYTANLREKGSKFIGYLFHSATRDEFEDRLNTIKTKYPDATHHCYAWRIDPHKGEEFVQDDGEPGGTAGTPILNRLKAHHLLNCGIVVIRYYGGTKLGKSGLITAYGETAERCIRKATLLTLIKTVEFSISYPYDRQNEIDRLKNSYNFKELESTYLEDVTLHVACPLEKADAFSAHIERLEHLDIVVKKIGRGFITE